MSPGNWFKDNYSSFFQLMWHSRGVPIHRAHCCCRNKSPNRLRNMVTYCYMNILRAITSNNSDLSWMSFCSTLDQFHRKCSRYQFIIWVWYLLSRQHFSNMMSQQSCMIWQHVNTLHDDVIKWKHFPCYWPFVRGIEQSPVNSPHKGKWRGALTFSFICASINGWVYNREAGDLKCHLTHNDVIVMLRPR